MNFIIFSINEQLKEHNNFYADPDPACSGEINCIFCGSEQTKSCKMELRNSPDKPFDTFVTCIRCGHRWKE